MSILNHTANIHNPFSTRFVRPGAIPYQFPAGMSTESLIDQWRSQNWRSAIIGPHGSGKSTLLATLIPAIEAIGCTAHSIALHDGQRKLPDESLKSLPPSAFRLPPSTSAGQARPLHVIIIDGYEQLSWWSRRRILRLCGRKKFGLLITAHADEAASGLPILLRTKPELAEVQNLIENFLPSHIGLISLDDIAAAFESNAGNVRETLFFLYDLFEKRKRG